MAMESDSQAKRHQLSEILDDRISIMETDDTEEAPQDVDTPQDAAPSQEGFCVECKDQEVRGLVISLCICASRAALIRLCVLAGKL